MSGIKAQGGYFAITPTCKIQLQHDPAYADVQLDDIPAADQQRMADGHAYEAKISTIWADTLNVTSLPERIVEAATGPGSFDDVVADVAKKLRGRQYVWVPECDRSTKSKKLREVITVAAMRAGAELIWNARLPVSGDRISEPDFLIRGDRNSQRRYGYLPGDVKDAKTMEGASAPVSVPVSSMEAFTFEDAQPMVIAEGKPKKKHSMQLAHYHEHLCALGFGVEGDVWGAIIGRELKLVWRSLTDSSVSVADPVSGQREKKSLLDHYRDEFDLRRRVAIAAADPDADLLAVQEWKQDCTSCEYRTVCHDDLVDADHITLLNGVTPTRAAVHYQAGITTRAQLAGLDWVTASIIEAGCDVGQLLTSADNWGDPDAPVEDLVGRTSPAVLAALRDAGVVTVGQFSRLHRQTASSYSGVKAQKLTAAIDAARVAKAGKVHLARDVTSFCVPRADIELDVDMETDSSGLIYMWGTRLTVRTKGLQVPGPAYRPFVTWESADEADEARVFAEFWSWLNALRTLATNSGLTFKAYYYTAAEDRCMRHLASVHRGVPGIPTEDEVETLIASDDWYDMYPLVAKQLVWPTENLSLKSTAKWARHSWRDTDASGDSSTVWYRDAVYASDPQVRDEARQRLLDYNEDDVVATFVLREWLSKLSSARDPKHRIPPVALLNDRFVKAPRRRRTAK